MSVGASIVVPVVGGNTMARSIVGAAALAVAAWGLGSGGCTQLNASHCGNQAGDATCEQRNAMTPFCDKCQAAADGCVAGPPIDPECGFGGGASSTTELPDATTTSSSSSSGESTSEAADSSSSSGEPVLCGNGVIDPGEACDGVVVAQGASCADEGFGEGVPTCVDDCSMLNYTDCPAYDECGNEEVAFGEECDGTNLLGRTCEDYPNRTGGGLACSPRCTFDLAACLPCVESDEPCVVNRDVCCNPKDQCDGVLVTTECCQGLGCPL
jgi:hypothetical protein